MRVSHLLISAALAASTGIACAQGAGLAANGSARIDGTGAGLNAGAGASASGNAGAPDARSMDKPSAAEPDAAANDTRILGSGRATPGNIVPDNLPGTMDPKNATVGINGTGTLDGSVPARDVDVTRELRDEVQR